LKKGGGKHAGKAGKRVEGQMPVTRFYFFLKKFNACHICTCKKLAFKIPFRYISLNKKKAEGERKR
jgi:hypothetical protein